MDDFDSLERLDKARIRFQSMGLTRICESAYFQHGLGILRDEDWAAIVGDMLKMVSLSSFPTIWALISDRSGARFRTFVDQLVNETGPRMPSTQVKAFDK